MQPTESELNGFESRPPLRVAMWLVVSVIIGGVAVAAVLSVWGAAPAGMMTVLIPLYAVAVIGGILFFAVSSRQEAKALLKASEEREVGANRIYKQYIASADAFKIKHQEKSSR